MAGPEFGELQQHVLVMYKVLSGPRSGGACWHDKLFEILQQMDFKSSIADPDIWMSVKNMLWHIGHDTYFVRNTSNCTV